MLSGFPQLDGLLKKRAGINKAVQEQRPGQFQAMPAKQPQDMQVGQPQAEQPYQPNVPQPMTPPAAQETYQPTGVKLGQSKGSISQALFNRQQQDANRGTFGAMAKRRRF